MYGTTLYGAGEKIPVHVPPGLTVTYIKERLVGIFRLYPAREDTGNHFQDFFLMRH